MKYKETLKRFASTLALAGAAAAFLVSPGCEPRGMPKPSGLENKAVNTELDGIVAKSINTRRYEVKPIATVPETNYPLAILGEGEHSNAVFAGNGRRRIIYLNDDGSQRELFSLGDGNTSVASLYAEGNTIAFGLTDYRVIVMKIKREGNDLKISDIRKVWDKEEAIFAGLTRHGDKIILKNHGNFYAAPSNSAEPQNLRTAEQLGTELPSDLGLADERYGRARDNLVLSPEKGDILEVKGDYRQGIVVIPALDNRSYICRYKQKE